MKVLGLACLISAAAAAAVPGDDWKAWKGPECPQPVTVTATVTSYQKEVVKYPVTEVQKVTETQKQTVTVTATVTATATKKEVSTVTQVQYVTATVTAIKQEYKECPTPVYSSKWQDWH